MCSNISVLIYRHMPTHLLIRIAGWVMVWVIRDCIPLRRLVPDNSMGTIKYDHPSIPWQLSQCIWSCWLAYMCLLSYKGLSGLVRLIWSVSGYPELNPESKCSWALVWFLFKEFTESQACIDRLRQSWSALRQTGQVSKPKVLLKGVGSPLPFYEWANGLSSGPGIQEESLT